jgi:exopolysaccharide biosynthesis protein
VALERERRAVSRRRGATWQGITWHGITRPLAVGALAVSALLPAVGAVGTAHAVGATTPAGWLPTTPPDWPLVVDKTSTPSVAITHGVSEYSETYDTVTGRQHTQVLNVDLADPNVRVGVVEAGDRVEDSADETVTSMGDRTGAVAGVNGDYFDINATGQPIGGVIVNGRVLKSPTPNYQAQLGILPDGRMVMGQETYTGSVTDTTTGAPSQAIASVNTTSSLAAGQITEVTPDLGDASGLTSSTEVLGTYSANAHTLTVTEVTTGVTALSTLPAGDEALLGGKTAGTWLADNVHVGDTLSITQSISPNNNLTALVDGATTLVKDGQIYNDPTGAPPGGTNPETAVGITKDGRHAILVTLDGRLGEATATGVTPAEVAGYLIAHGAYSGILFDGGGSTELAAREPGGSGLTVLNTPSDGDERPVANGIFVYSTETAPMPATKVVANDGKPVTTVPGATVPVPVYATDAEQNPASGSISVSVEPPSLATWSNGQLTVKRAGDGILTARSGDAVTTEPIRVVDTLSSLTISPTQPDLANGTSQQFTLAGTAPGLGPSGQTAQVPAAAATWSVSDSSLGTIGPSGLFTADANNGGMVTVTATVAGATASASVAVGQVATTIDPMNDPNAWSLRNTTGEQATLTATSDDAPPGDTSGSMALTYDVPAGNGVKQLVLSPTSTLTAGANAQGQEPTALGVWIKGDDRGLWFAESYIDIGGATTTLYPTYVTFNGWRLVIAQIPAGVNFPVHISFVDFLAVNPPSTIAGTVSVGGLEALYSPRPPAPVTYVPIAANPSWLHYDESAEQFAHGGSTLLVGGDAHLVAGDPGSTAADVLGSIAGRLPTLPAAAQPNQAQFLGNLANDGELADLGFAKSTIAKLGIPAADAVGSDETSQGALPENGDFAQEFGATHYAYTDGAADVIVTDSAHGGLTASDADQSPAEAQYPWLVQQLTAAAGPAVLVATQMPAYDPHPAANSQFTDRWEARMYVRLLQRYQQTHPTKHVVMLDGYARGFADEMLDPTGANATAAQGGLPQLTYADLGVAAYAPANQGGFVNYGLIHVAPNGDIAFTVEPVLASIAVDAPSATLAVGARETVTASGTEVAGDDASAQGMPITMPIADPASHMWSSSDSTVASVNPDTGVVTARHAGTATITVTSGGVSAATSITVTG